MSMLLISLCCDPLSELEFVRPVARILGKCGINHHVKHYLEVTPKDIHSMDKVIICGSALKDEKFLKGEWFRWLENVDRPVLGIGSGFHVIAKAFGCPLINRTRIGIFNVKLVKENRLIDERNFYAYFLTKRVARIMRPLKTLAKTGNLDCIIAHESKSIYSCLFHPEVTKPEIILNFALRI